MTLSSTSGNARCAPITHPIPHPPITTTHHRRHKICLSSSTNPSTSHNHRQKKNPRQRKEEHNREYIFFLEIRLCACTGSSVACLLDRAQAVSVAVPPSCKKALLSSMQHVPAYHRCGTARTQILNDHVSTPQTCVANQSLCSSILAR